MLNDARIELQVENGVISNLAFRVAASSDSLAKSEALSELRGHRFTANSLAFMERAFSEQEPEQNILQALRAWRDDTGAISIPPDDTFIQVAEELQKVHLAMRIL